MRLTCWIWLVFSVQNVFAENSVRLGLNWKPEPQFGGFYEAQRLNLLNNPKVELIEGGSGTPTVQMLANDKIEFGIISAEELLINNDRNPQSLLIAIFASFQTNPQVIITRSERNFKNLGDVFSNEGTLALQSGLSFAQFLFQKYPNKKVNIVPYMGGISGLINDPKFSQQGFISSEPLLASKANIKVDSFLVAKEGFNPYTTVLSVKKAYYEKNTAQVLSIVKAVRLGWESYLRSPDLANQQMAKLNPAMSLETFKASAEAQKSLIEGPKKLGQMELKRWETLCDQLHKLGLIKTLKLAPKAFLNI